ncbi:hypothetical protein CEXT_277401 [Caerostris extrusa]|uniref:Uncharacterized protein n=1 Tax=Caerostris extrusa TaxID=172846 RepID=A0AAV4S812_CAEEX|nr:hypothetical protein CEXT_277401 [Caerostris extrusa]
MSEEAAFIGNLQDRKEDLLSGRRYRLTVKCYSSLAISIVECSEGIKIGNLPYASQGTIINSFEKSHLKLRE